MIARRAWPRVPGELETRLRLDLKRAAADGLAPVCLTGGTCGQLGYFVSPEALAHPSDVACASLYGAQGGETLRDVGKGLLDRLAIALIRASRPPLRQAPGTGRTSEGS